MATIAQLWVDLNLRANDFNNQIRAAQREAREFEKTLAPTSKLLDSIGTSLTNVGAIASIGVTAPLVALGVSAVRNFNEAADAAALLENAIRSTGGAAGKTSDELQKMASTLQANTIFGDDEIIRKVQTQLLTFTNIAGTTFDKATKAALDMSTVLGQDLQSSAIQLGKALNDPINGVTALQRVGVKLNATQKDLVKSFVEVGDVASAQAVILDELTTEFGGAAEAAAKAGSGPMKVLANQMNDLSESFGKLIADILPPFIALLTDLVKWFNNLSPGTKQVIVVMAALAAAIGPVLLVLGTMASSMSSLILMYGKFAPLITGTVIPAISSFGSSLAALIAANGPLILTVAAISAAVIALYELVQAYRGAKQAQEEAVQAQNNAASSAERAAKTLKEKYNIEIKQGTMTTYEWEQSLAEAARTAVWFDKKTQEVANAHKSATETAKSSKQAHDNLGNSMNNMRTPTTHLTAELREQEEQWIKNRAAMYEVEIAVKRMQDAFDQAAPSIKAPLPSEIPILNPGEVPQLPGLPRVGLPPNPGPAPTASTEQWEHWRREGQKAIDKVVDDISEMFVQGIIHGKSFWESFKNLGKNAVTGIVDTLTSKMLHAFLDPFSMAVGKLLDGLTSGLTSFLSEFGSRLAGIFGGAASSAVAQAAGTAAQAAGSAGSTAGNIAGGIAGGTISGTLGAIGSLGSFATGIISNFQNARQEGTLNAIEYNTRASRIHLQVIIEDFLWKMRTHTEWIMNHAETHTNQLDAIYNVLDSRLGNGGNGSGSQTITINMPVTTSADPVEFASKVRTVLKSALKTDRDGVRSDVILAASQNRGLASSLPQG